MSTSAASVPVLAYVILFKMALSGSASIIASNCSIRGIYAATGSAASVELRVLQAESTLSNIGNMLLTENTLHPTSATSTSGALTAYVASFLGSVSGTVATNDVFSVSGSVVRGSYNSGTSYLCVGVAVFNTTSETLTGFETITSAAGVDVNAQAGAVFPGTHGSDSILAQCGNDQTTTTTTSTTTTTTTTTVAASDDPATNTTAAPGGPSDALADAASSADIGVIAGAASGGLVVLALILCLCWYYVCGGRGIEGDKDRAYDPHLVDGKPQRASAFDHEPHHAGDFHDEFNGDTGAAVAIPSAVDDRHSDRDDDDDHHQPLSRAFSSVGISAAAASGGSAEDGQEMGPVSPASQTHRDLQASLRAASFCAAAITGDMKGSEAASNIKSVVSDSSNSFVSDIARGKLQQWTKIVVDLNHDDVEELHDASTSLFWDGCVGLFDALSGAPTPIGECAAVLGGLFSLGKRCLVNAYECQLLAQRCTRLLPILIRSATVDMTGAQGMFAEMRIVLDLCFGLVEQFVPPKQAKEGEEEEWVGARMWNWIKHKSQFLINSEEDFAECHMRLDRVIRETSLALQLEVHATVQRSAEEIRASVQSEVRQAVEQMQGMMEKAMNESTQEVRGIIEAQQAELFSTFAPLLNRIESKLDAMSNIFSKLSRKREWRDLQVAPERVEITDKELGRGGFGAVYLARFDHTILVAAKCVGAADDDEAKQVLREAKLLMSLRSPGVVSCFGVVSKTVVLGAAASALRDGSGSNASSSGGSQTATAASASPPQRVHRVFVLMERCMCSMQDIAAVGVSSPTMRNFVSAEGSAAVAPLSFSVVFHLIGTVASGLFELHQRGLVHRDMKPANVLLGSGSPPVAKLSDLGSVSKSIEHLDALRSQYTTMASTGGGTSSIAFGSMGTTFAFCAPELLRDASATANPACDIYSLGMTIVQLLTGESLGFTVESLPDPVDDWEEYVKSSRAQRDNGAEAKWPRDVFDLVSRMISTKPSRRMDITDVIRRVVEIQEQFPLEDEEAEWLGKKARELSKKTLAAGAASSSSRPKSGSKKSM